MEQKEKFYKKQWFMWVFLILFPPIGIALVWLVHKEFSVKKRIILTVVSSLWLIFSLSQADDAEVPEQYRGIGIRIEDDIVITETGNENLTASVVKKPEEIEALMAAARKQ